LRELGILPDELEAKLTSFHIQEWITHFKMEKEAHDRENAKLKLRR
jgi:hypothetical protein